MAQKYKVHYTNDRTEIIEGKVMLFNTTNFPTRVPEDTNLLNATLIKSVKPIDANSPNPVETGKEV